MSNLLLLVCVIFLIAAIFHTVHKLNNTENVHIVKISIIKKIGLLILIIGIITNYLKYIELKNSITFESNTNVLSGAIKALLLDTFMYLIIYLISIFLTFLTGIYRQKLFNKTLANNG